MTADFLNENREQLSNTSSNIDELLNVIRKNYCPAPYETFYIAANCFQRTIKLYRNKFFDNLNPEIFENDYGALDKDPIKMLFTGSIELGHFQAIIKKK